MSFNEPLTSDQLTQLRRRRWQGDQLISFCDNVYALAARVLADINVSDQTTSAVIPYYNVSSGSYTDIDEGMTVICSPTSDIRDFRAIRLHVRYLEATSDLIYVSEFSDQILANSYIWVLFHYDVIDNLSRPVGTTTITQYKQYDEPFELMAPIIVGLQTGYADWVDANGHYDIAFDVSNTFAAESGASISSYQFSVVPTGAGTATVIAGSAASANVTYRFTYGEYFLKLVVTDSNGVTWFRHSMIKAHDPVNYPPSVHFDGAEITREVSQGQSARISGYAGVDTLLNGTMCIIWVDEQYSDINFSNAAGTLFNNIDLVGWIEAEENMFVTDPTASAFASVSFEVQGLASRLMRLEGQMLAMQFAANPAVWDEINDLTPWRAVVHFLQRHTTALQLGDFTADSVDETFLFPTITTTAGRALDNVTGSQGIAEEINACLEFASDGRMYFTRREPFVDTDLSHTPIIVATWSGQDLIDGFHWKFNHYAQYGICDADGASWPGTVNIPVQPAKNRAPGLAQGSGPDQTKITAQILASTSDIVSAQTELAQRCGTALEMANNVAELSGSHPAQFHWLQPSYGQVYVWDLDSSFNVRGWDINAGTHWMLKSVTVRHDNRTGSRTVNPVYIPVLTGDPGTNIPIISNGSQLPALPNLPPMPAFPDIEIPLWPDEGLLPSQIAPNLLNSPVIAKDGNSLLVATATRAYWLSNFIKLTTPTANNVTPADLGSFEIQAVAISPFFTPSAIPAHDLAADGANSAVWYTPNVAAGTVAQTKGDNVTGTFTVLRETQTDGTILIYGSGTDAQTPHTYDFTVSDQGFVHEPDNIPGGLGVYVAATGWDDTYGVNTADGTDTRGVDIVLVFGSPISLTQIQMTYNLTKGVVSGGINNLVTAYLGAVAVGGQTVASNSDGDGTGKTLTFTGGPVTADSVRLQVICGWRSPGGGGDPGGSCLITSAEITYGVSSGDASVVMSDDNGVTWDGAIDVGTSPGAVGGFDVQRAGPNSFAAADGKVFRATTLGGAYSAYYTITGGVEAACIVIPYFNWAGTKQTSATNPDIIVALTGLDGSSRSLLWIEGGVTPGTVHDITPVAGITFDNANCITISYNHHIAVFGLVSGVYKLYRTTDKGSTWTLVGTRTAPQFIRGRRNDSSAAVSGSNKGQLYLADSNMYWSSKWDQSGPFIRNMPTTPIIAFDTLF